MKTKANSKTGTKRKFKKRYWLLVDLAVLVIFLVLLLYKPAGYKPFGPDYRKGSVHSYLTYLSSEIYNGVQLQEAFEVVVPEKKINESIADWSEITEDLILSAPAVRFTPGNIKIMATAVFRGVEFVVTAGLEPEIDENGLLNLNLKKVKIGAMNITYPARVLARKKYAQQLKNTPVNKEHWRTKIAGSLLYDEPFDPVFSAEDKKARFEQISIQKEKLILRIAPAQ